MILYAVICRAQDAVVLAECSAQGLGGNAGQASLSLLEFLRDNPSHVVDEGRMTFVQRNDAVTDWFSDLFGACADVASHSSAEYFFHVSRKSDVYYCCLSDDADARDHKVSYAFLDHVQREFAKKFTAKRVEKASAYGMDKKFLPVMRSAMHHYNVNNSTLRQEERVSDLHAEIEELKAVMGRNINLALRRGENAEKLLEKSDALLEDTMMFQKRTTQLKRTLRRKNWGLNLLFFAAGCASVYLVAAMFCGLSFSKCTKKSS